MKFLTTVLQTEPVKNLQSFAENNPQTQGKFTIGDEKVFCEVCLFRNEAYDEISNIMFSCE